MIRGRRRQPVKHGPGGPGEVTRASSACSPAIAARRFPAKRCRYARAGRPVSPLAVLACHCSKTFSDQATPVCTGREARVTSGRARLPLQQDVFRPSDAGMHGPGGPGEVTRASSPCSPAIAARRFPAKRRRYARAGRPGRGDTGFQPVLACHCSKTFSGQATPVCTGQEARVTSDGNALHLCATQTKNKESIGHWNRTYKA